VQQQAQDLDLRLVQTEMGILGLALVLFEAPYLHATFAIMRILSNIG